MTSLECSFILFLEFVLGIIIGIGIGCSIKK